MGNFAENLTLGNRFRPPPLFLFVAHFDKMGISSLHASIDHLDGLWCNLVYEIITNLNAANCHAVGNFIDFGQK